MLKLTDRKSDVQQKNRKQTEIAKIGANRVLTEQKKRKRAENIRLSVCELSFFGRKKRLQCVIRKEFWTPINQD